MSERQQRTAIALPSVCCSFVACCWILRSSTARAPAMRAMQSKGRKRKHGCCCMGDTWQPRPSFALVRSVRSFVIWETHPSTDLTYKRSVSPLLLVHSPIGKLQDAETAIAGRWMAVLTRIASRIQVHRQSPSTAGSRHRTPQAGVTSPAGSCPSSLQLGPEVGCNGPQTRFAGRLRSSSARLGTAAPAAAVRGPPTARRGEPQPD